jgi:hypothetical protein
VITFEYEDGTLETDVYTNVCIKWDDDWVPMLDSEEVEGLELDSIKVMRPQREDRGLYTCYIDACADSEMAHACAHMRRLRITTLDVDDPIHMHCKFSCHPEAIYKGFNSCGISFGHRGLADVEEELWENVVRITRRNV